MIRQDLKRPSRKQKKSRAEAPQYDLPDLRGKQRRKEFLIVCGRVFGNRALVRAMVFAGLFLLMSVGAVLGQEKDPASSPLITQSSGGPGKTKQQAIQIPTGPGSQTVPGSQTIRGPIMGNQAASQSQAAAPLDSSASANGDIRDIRGPLHIPDPITWLYYGVAGCLFLLALMWFWKWIAGRKKIREKLPFELALEQLERAKAFMKPETAGRFSVMVSKAVRTYIESRFEMEVTRHTTEEFMRRVAAEPSGEIKEYGGLLNGFLGYCDLAKFARYALTMKQMEEMLQSARHFVDVTKPSPDDQKTNHKEIEGDPAVDNVPVRNKPSLMKRWWEKGFRFTSRKTTAPVGLDHPGAVAAGGR
jgi:hypothetical protein